MLGLSLFTGMVFEMIDAYEGDLSQEFVDDRELDYISKQFDLDLERAKGEISMALHRLETLSKAQAVLHYRIAAEKARRAEAKAEAKAEEQPEAPLRATIDTARMSIITDIVWNEFSEEGNGLAGYVEHYRGTEGRDAKIDLINNMSVSKLRCGFQNKAWSNCYTSLIFIDRHVNENMGHEDNTWCGIEEYFTEECEDSPVGFKIVNMDYKNPVTGEVVDVWDSLKARLWTQDPITEVA